MLLGTIRVIDGQTYFVTTDILWSEPTLRTDAWLVARDAVPVWDGAQARLNGIVVEIFCFGGVGRATVEIGAGKASDLTTYEPIPAPKTRGKPTRWHEGRWEKLLSRGWVPA